LRYGKIRFVYTVKAKEFKVTIRRNLLYNSQPWVLTLRRGNKIFYKQQETLGWSYEDFEKIEKLSKIYG